MTFQGEFGDSCAENGESEGEREGPGAAGASSECSGAFSGFSADDAGHPIVFFFIQTVAQQHEIDLHLIFQGVGALLVKVIQLVRKRAQGPPVLLVCAQGPSMIRKVRVVIQELRMIPKVRVISFILNVSLQRFALSLHEKNPNILLTP